MNPNPPTKYLLDSGQGACRVDTKGTVEGDW